MLIMDPFTSTNYIKSIPILFGLRPYTLEEPEQTYPIRH